MSDATKQEVMDLLADQAVWGLDPAEQARLDAMLVDHPEWDDDTLALAAAEADLAMTREEEIPLPIALRVRVQEDAQAYFAESKGDRGTGETNQEAEIVPFKRSGALIWTGWLVAAAMLILAALSWLQPVQQSEAPVLSAAQLRDQLVREAADTQVVSWSATEDPSAAGASGDVVWSKERQIGYMRIKGLAANDTTQLQYQLWIFDKDRDDKFPVDGGVFDMPQGIDEVVVPIDAKLLVNEPTLFAVTVEKPGGVVVSSRERIVLVAQPGA